MKLNFRLDRVENLHDISAESDPAFYNLLRKGVLLGLHEAGEISDMQLRQAEENLLRQPDDEH